MASLQEFCLALKAVRERKGITLDEISTITKIPSSMFAALERGDLSHWPKGLFGREFFRAYTGVLGIRDDEACKEFVRLFRDETSAESAVTPEPGSSTPPAPATVRPRTLLDAISQLFRKADVKPVTSAEEKRDWTSDARRVGPPATPPARIRIKMS